jgi:predicted small metal-binding protein
MRTTPIVTTSRQRGDTLAATGRGTLPIATVSTGGQTARPCPQESAMLHQVSCECGYQARENDEAAVVRTVQQHVRDNHPDLVEQVTPDVIRGWIELVP